MTGLLVHTLQGVHMSRAQPLRPTLWRTCRVLANRTRLRVLGFLAGEPDQSVSAIASRLKLPPQVASQYLRALEARGFLTARRAGRRVYYRLGSGEVPGQIHDLISAVAQALRARPESKERIFKLATAFTHFRRITIFRTVGDGAATAEGVQRATGISRFAVMRHLAKLEARGFIANREGRLSTLSQRDAVGRALLRLASEPPE